MTFTLAVQAPLHAASLYWDGNSTTADADGGAGTWSTGATTNWDTTATAGTDVTWTDGSDAVFPGVAGTVTVSGTVSTPSLTFSTTGYTVTGGTITLTGAPFIDTGANNSTVASVLGGTAGLTKNGTGSLTLSGANTYSGTLTVSAGTLKAGNAAALGLAGTSNGTTVLSGATLDINAQALTTTEIITISGTGVGGAGALVNTGADQLNAVNKLVLAGNATLGGTGRFDIRPGTTPTLDLAGFTLTKEGTNQFSLVGASITPGSITINAGILSVETTSVLQGTGTVTINANGTLGLYGTTGTNITRGITSNGGAIRNLGSGATVNSTISLATSTTTTIGSPNTIATTLAGIISGSGALTKTGTDTFTLSAANTYTGATTVNGGLLVLSNTNSSPSYSIATGAVLEMQNQSMPVNASISGTGTLRKTQTGTLIWGSTAGTFAMGSGGLIDVQAGIFTGGSNANEVWTSNLSDLNVAAAGTFDGVEANIRVDALTGSGIIKSGYTGAGYSTFTFGVDNGSGTFTGTLVNSAAAANITKAGTGTQILTGANTYTGTTTINGGVLEIGANGTLATSGITVNATGTFRSDVAGKTFSTIAAANNSTLSTPALTGGTTNLTGVLNLADGGTINVAPLLGNATTGTYDLITATGGITGTGTPVLNLSTYGTTRATGSVVVTGNKLQLVLTGTGANLVWNNASAAGVATGTWDNTLLNFNNGGSNDAFQAFDAVTFDDTLLSGTAKTVNLTGTLAPSVVTVNNSNGNYTFGSTGTLTGGGSLVKSGSSTLTIASTTAYTMTGSITVNGGTLDLSGKQVTPSSVTLAGGTFNNATVTPTSLDLQSGTAGATFTGSGTWTKTTAGTATLNAANTITGAGVISAGTLSLGNTATIGSGTVSIASGATLAVSRAANSLAFSNAFSGTGSITLTGTNTGAATNASEVTLNGNSSGFSGPLSVTGARATLTSSATAGGTGPLTVTGPGGQFFLGGGTYTNNFFLNGNGWTENAGTLGALRINGGTVSGTITLTGNSRITTYQTSGTISGPIVESGGSRSLELGITGAVNTLTLTGASTYTGPTTITNATVNLNGSLGATAVTVASGSTLGGIGSINSGGSLTLAAGSNLSVNPVAGALTVNGNVAVNATTTVNLTTAASGGVITVLNYTGAVTGTAANLALANAANYRQAVFNVAANKITVDLGNKALVWNGTSGGQWNVGGANLRWNTTGSGETDAFFQGDAVTFDDTGVTTAIALGGAVQPASITANAATKNYTITSSGANVIGGIGGLTKSGASTLTLTGAANTYTGGTIVNGGTLSLGLGGPAGTIRGLLTINSGATVTTTVGDALGYTVGTQVTTLTLNGGTLNNTSGGNEGFTTNVSMTGGTVSSTGGAFNFTNSYGITSNASSTTSVFSSPILIRDTNNLPVSVASGTTASGIDLDVSGVVSGNALTKSGAGTLRLGGANTYTAGTTLSAGTLIVANTSGSATGTGAVTAAAGTTLTGGGTISGALTSAGTIAPGVNSTGTLTTGASALTGTLAIEVDGANADKLVVNGNLTLGGSLSVSLLGGGFTAPSYVIATYTGTLTGTFASAPFGYNVNYDTANKQIVLTQSTGYASWAGTNGLTSGNNGPTQNPDNDSLANLLEYVLMANPLAFTSAELPVQGLDNDYLYFYFLRSTQSKQDTNVAVQWGTNLSSWTDIAIPDTDPADGVVFIDQSNPTFDNIMVKIPRSNAVDGKLFVRLKATPKP
ncbi:beta strand repeat-containing protein [Luteolibacter ambystomatis]|uniref:beta strand repeat-containing protein n=1 Tax=Luteolibacter ambystomatis TaxID=2824561 RepID=UPI003626CAF7